MAKVTRVVDGKEVESTEQARCKVCGAEGLVGDFPDQGGIVGGLCDACGEPQ